MTIGLSKMFILHRNRPLRPVREKKNDDRCH